MSEQASSKQSDCCAARMMIVSHLGGTSYYACGKCGRACWTLLDGDTVADDSRQPHKHKKESIR